MFLAVDAFSRRLIGWALDRTLEADLTVAAPGACYPRRGISCLAGRGLLTAFPSMEALPDFASRPQIIKPRQDRGRPAGSSLFPAFPLLYGSPTGFPNSHLPYRRT